MQLNLRSAPVRLLATLALPALFIVYLAVSGAAPPFWFGLALFASSLLIMAIGFVAGQLYEYRNPRAGRMDERAQERFLSGLTFFAVLGIDILALLVATSSPAIALVIVALAGIWIVLWVPRSMRAVGIQSSVVIRRDPAAVFSFVSDFRNQPRFALGVHRVEQVTPGPIGRGTQFHAVAQVRPGVVFEGVEEIIDYEPNQRLTSRLASGLRPNLEELTFEAAPGGTLLSHRFDSETSYSAALLGAGLARPLTRRQMLKGRQTAWAKLKEVLETDGSTSPAL